MEEQERWFDIPSKSLTSDQIRDQLSVVAGEVLEKRGVKGPNSKLVGEVRDKLALKGTPNGGTDATNDLKWFIKLGRQNAIHVTVSATATFPNIGGFPLLTRNFTPCYLLGMCPTVKLALGRLQRYLRWIDLILLAR